MTQDISSPQTGNTGGDYVTEPNPQLNSRAASEKLHGTTPKPIFDMTDEEAMAHFRKQLETPQVRRSHCFRSPNFNEPEKHNRMDLSYYTLSEEFSK